MKAKITPTLISSETFAKPHPRPHPRHDEDGDGDEEDEDGDGSVHSAVLDDEEDLDEVYEEPTYRFHVSFDDGASVDWKKLVKAKEKEMEMADRQPEEHGDGEDIDQENGDGSEDERSMGSYYDTDDSFIDDSEMVSHRHHHHQHHHRHHHHRQRRFLQFDAEEANKLETKVEGFFIQQGDIAVKKKYAAALPQAHAHLHLHLHPRRNLDTGR